jgi:tRNA pseudouridine55 synthase
MLGFVNVHKPVGPTSTQVTAQIRRIFSLLKGAKLPAGHLGTLDPGASGVLPIALGSATRLIPFIEDRRKTYVCTLVLGRATTTGDALGETLRETPVPAEVLASLERVLPQFLGAIKQIPPMYSAVHHGGKRLYELARAGRTVERAPRAIVLHDVRVLDVANEAVRLRVVCSEGTYIRTLCEDIGNAMGVAAHMGSLVRQGAGSFVLERSFTLEQIAALPLETLLPPEEVIPFPTIRLDARGVVDFRAGRMVTYPCDITTVGDTSGLGAETRCVRKYMRGSATTPWGISNCSNADACIFVRDGAHALIGVGECRGARIAPRKVFG